MACSFITGTRGSGKSLYSVIEAFSYLNANKSVATNLNIYPDCRIKVDYKLTRIPDIPSSSSFRQLGLGCDEKFLTKEHYDKTKFGLILLDEISLFLNSKSDKEFKAIVAWLVQSRKYGWDIFCLAQNKEQVHDEVYKALCDNLVICKSDDLVSIPYMGRIMRMFGFKGMLPENYTALKLNGRSEQSEVMETISYSRKGFSLAYDTSQTFVEDYEYLNNRTVDMRCNYSVVSEYLLSGKKLIDEYKIKIDDITNKVSSIKEGDTMALNHHEGAKNKMKIGLLIVGLIVFFYFNNPLDNKLLANVTGQEVLDNSEVEFKQALTLPQQTILSVNTVDIFQSMIVGSELSIPIYNDTQGLNATIQIKNETRVTFISLDDLRVLGWYAVKVGNVFYLKKGKTTIQIPLSQTGYTYKN
ncbi:MAG: hypothetical protein COB22_08635 [Cycloclasticus sp.]|nr:MAG: hypothetical protein COB22_08635 [Cycloclasticus sp.]